MQDPFLPTGCTQAMIERAAGIFDREPATDCDAPDDVLRYGDWKLELYRSGDQWQALATLDPAFNQPGNDYDESGWFSHKADAVADAERRCDAMDAAAKQSAATVAA